MVGAPCLNRQVLVVLLLMLGVSRAFLILRASSMSAARARRLRMSTDDALATPRSADQPRTAMAWLRTSLRLSDNEALSKAAALGPDGLAVVFTWERGTVPGTPSAIFECAAARELDRKLCAAGSNLTVVHTSDAPRDVAAIVRELQPTAVVVDASEKPDDADKLKLALEEFGSTSVEIISVLHDTLLMPIEKSMAVLKNPEHQGGYMFRWEDYMRSMAEEDVPSPRQAPVSLPPPLKSMKPNIAPLPEPTAAGHWARKLLEEWGEVSEEEALRRAVACSEPGKREMSNESHKYMRIGDACPSRLSPYLRWGVISSRQAAAAAAAFAKIGNKRQFRRTKPKRFFVWRDWAHICYRMIGSLQRGEPVIAEMDGCCASGSWRCSNMTDMEDAAAKDPVFARWCVGRTGAPLVDAGMRQLWREGWMPRRLRLITACCLVEGLGIDWRLGRDWFEHTLIDHDPAINEVMWQNAGLCGVDYFYTDRWQVLWEMPEVVPGDKQYVEYWSKAQLHFPPVLQRAALKEPLGGEDIRAAATQRRKAIRSQGVYKAARYLRAHPVRIAWSGKGSKSCDISSGEVCGVGHLPIDQFRFELAFEQDGRNARKSEEKRRPKK